MRVRILVGWVALGSTVSVGAACGFPDVSFSSDSSLDAGGANSAMNATEPVDATETPAPPPSSEPTSAPPPSNDDGRDGEKRDAGADVETNSPAPTPTVTATTPPPPTPTPTPTPTPPPAPTPTTTATTPPAPSCDPDADFGTSSADRNCDGVVTKESPENITCAALSPCTQGFAGTVACGATGTYNVCRQTIGVLGSTLCQVERAEVRTQRCR